MSEVIKFIQENANQNCFIFYFNEDGEVKENLIRCSEYKDPGIKLPGSSLGDLYEIIVVSAKKKEVERFQAILISPAVYINRMLNDGFWGAVGNATTSSKKIFDELEEGILEKFRH